MHVAFIVVRPDDLFTNKNPRYVEQRTVHKCYPASNHKKHLSIMTIEWISKTPFSHSTNKIMIRFERSNHYTYNCNNEINPLLIVFFINLQCWSWTCNWESRAYNNWIYLPYSNVGFLFVWKQFLPPLCDSDHLSTYCR